MFVVPLADKILRTEGMIDEKETREGKMAGKQTKTRGSHKD